MCQKSQVNATSTDSAEYEEAAAAGTNSDSESDYVYMINTVSDQCSTRRLPVSQVVLMDTIQAPVLVDTGSKVNILDSNTFRKLNPQPKLRNPDQKVFPYGEGPALPVLGVTTISVHAPATNRTVDADFHIVHGNTGNLLSCHTSQQLQLVKLTCSIQSYEHDIFAEYDTLFQGVGKIKDVEIKLHIDESIPSKSQRHRRTPFHTRKDVESELARLQSHDLIERVTGPTPWVSPIVITLEEERCSSLH